MLQKADPKNADLLVNINGELIHRDRAGISPFDSAVQGGDAVWEGLRLYDGRIFKLERHLDGSATRPWPWRSPRFRPRRRSSMRSGARSKRTGCGTTSTSGSR